MKNDLVGTAFVMKAIELTIRMGMLKGSPPDRAKALGKLRVPTPRAALHTMKMPGKVFTGRCETSMDATEKVRSI